MKSSTVTFWGFLSKETFLTKIFGQFFVFRCYFHQERVLGLDKNWFQWTPHPQKCGFRLLKCQKSFTGSWDIPFFEVREISWKCHFLTMVTKVKKVLTRLMVLAIAKKPLEIQKNQNPFLKADRIGFMLLILWLMPMLI